MDVCLVEAKRFPNPGSVNVAKINKQKRYARKETMSPFIDYNVSKREPLTKKVKEFYASLPVSSKDKHNTYISIGDFTFLEKDFLEVVGVESKGVSKNFMWLCNNTMMIDSKDPNKLIVDCNTPMH